ncbi:MAG: LemA family protein [Pseudomonadota bacterium]|uniref:LemA family protein n=1 Tax=Sphingomonas sp. ERG5 TaxID=1381597 RepID=UPI00068BAABD|nr:LemA family protein [Sphingomonas sp. ERG5]
MKFRAAITTGVLVGLAAMLSACGINSVPTAEENAKAKWADVQAAYQRRANLIPNLQATVKGAAASEKSILTDVIEARSKATAIQVTGADLTDPAKVQQFQAAQSQLNGSLSRLLANVEAYPELKSQANFSTFMSQIEGTENRINIAVVDYNKAVQDYNTRIRTFPDAVGAKIFYGSKPLVPFQATTPGAENAPTVDFGNSN